MATLTIADLDNGKRDLQTVDEVANSRAATATTRFGQQTTTLYESIRRINADGDSQLAVQEAAAREVISNLGFRVPVPYASGLNIFDYQFTVIGPDGNIYAPIDAPFTTGAWNSSQWYALQNVLNDRKIVLFASYSAAAAAAGTLPNGQYVRISKDETRQNAPADYEVSAGALSFLQLLSPNSQAFGAVGTGDVAPNLSSAISAGGRIELPRGAVNIQSRVYSGGQALVVSPGFQAYKTGTSDITLANAQNLPSMVAHDSYEKFDASKFWTSGPTVMAYGDSNTAWVDASGRIGVGQGSWPGYLEAFLGQYVYFAEGRVRGDGSPGQTSQYALDNLDLFISTLQPQITVLGWGTNDIAQGVSRAQYLSNMALLISRLQVTGQCVVVLGIPWHVTNFEKSKAWNSSLEELCRNYRVPFIPVYSLFANAPSTYFAADGVHYTAVANQILAKIIGETIVSAYSLPKNRMMLSAVSMDSPDGNNWSTAALIHTYGSQLQTVVTPDPYVRRLFPYSLKISSGTQAYFSSAGPFCAMFSWPDSSTASWTLNGSDFSPVTRGSVVRVNSVSARLSGSVSNFRVGSSSGDVYLCATAAEFPPGEHVLSSSEIRNGLYTPGKISRVRFGPFSFSTAMIPVASGVDVGYAPGSALPNVGPRSTRTGISSAPEGFLFLESDNELLFKFSSGAWAAVP